jgi:hypothetical protein
MTHWHAPPCNGVERSGPRVKQVNVSADPAIMTR